ncbi:phytoene/squalene synthase family protein [Rhodobacteraceae bacterium 2376]|uniref:Phytoene/squalene synthase family protein n=1 Tax=Rhabdonatronobacter sediminivivens TaxID=2743469 RepID=A0A7Z0HWH3_9RHOB|nr:phytoene/squalene synthase family protein [Rhabdonatronobacter sediminivivens]NYS23425.1 phytoene/squalene synthase family protein [Rhabdonatronobacter sediminivivens]
MIPQADLDHCRAAIRTGSLSFHAASKLLPGHVRDPALALYAFCRLADDAVDETAPGARAGAVLRLGDRLEAVYAGRPRNAPADRAFAAVVEGFEMPRALPEALLEGLAWDAQGRRHETLSDVLDYSARVAAAVGAMMCVLMRVRDPDRLARACDLGLAMQLTNIARDVGEDARAGRIYLPLAWLEDAGIAPARLLADPQPSGALRGVVARLLRQADLLYQRSEPGIAALPLSCRPGIFAARHVYAGIGTALRRLDCDSVTQRAHTGKLRKTGWLGLSVLRSAGAIVTPRPATLHAAPMPEVAYLVDAAARVRLDRSRSDAMIGVLGQLRARDMALRTAALGLDRRRA